MRVRPRLPCSQSRAAAQIVHPESQLPSALKMRPNGPTESRLPAQLETGARFSMLARQVWSMPTMTVARAPSSSSVSCYVLFPCYSSRRQEKAFPASRLASPGLPCRSPGGCKCAIASARLSNLRRTLGFCSFISHRRSSSVISGKQSVGFHVRC